MKTLSTEQLAIAFNVPVYVVQFVYQSNTDRFEVGKHYTINEEGERRWTERGGIDLAVLVNSPESWAMYSNYMDGVADLVAMVKALSEERT